MPAFAVFAPASDLDLTAPDAGSDDAGPLASDGLTLDTPLGPVDLVAIERALSGRPVDLTAAEVAYLFTRLAPTRTATAPVAAALSMPESTVRYRVRRGGLSATKVA